MKIAQILSSKYPEHFQVYKKKSLLTIWDWNYGEFLELLKKTNQSISEDPSQELYIICSHRPCLTNGYGLEKVKGKVREDLVEFDPNLSLDKSIFQIKRGGGLTFHHEGQINFYPIFHLTHHKKNLQTYMMRLLKTCSEILNEKLQTNKFHYKGPFLGLWHDDHKVGSIGMGLERYITQHGFSLNLFQNIDFNHEISKLYPCGISLQEYKSINQLYDIDAKFRLDFVESFKLKIFE